MRKIPAIAAALGLIASVYVFIASLYGLTLNKLGGRALLLHLGIFALAVPYIVVERMKANGQQFSYGGVAPYEGRPIWVKRSMGIVFAFFITFFLIFLIQGHAASREIIDGEYVLNNHGTIVRYLSANEYFQMKASELCLFASGWMANYGLMMYWWFPRPIAETPWTLDP
jgi:hypothetical protein